VNDNIAVKIVGAYCIRPYKISAITFAFDVGRMQYAPTVILIVSTPIRNLCRYLWLRGDRFAQYLRLFKRGESVVPTL